MNILATNWCLGDITGFMNIERMFMNIRFFVNIRRLGGRMFMNIKVFSMFMNIMYQIGGSATANGCS